MNEKYDIVVVGSGAGGAPLAHALTKAGAKVCVIERGKALEELSLDRDEIEWTRRKRFMPHARNDPHMFRKDESTRALATARAWTGNIVGGSTVTSDALMVRASEADFAQGDRMNKIAGIKAPNWPFGLAELAPYYDEAERFLGVKKAKEQGLKTHAIAGFLDAAAAKVGHTLSRAERAIVTHDRGLQKACEYRTLCEQYACPSNAKSTADNVFIKPAQALGMVLKTQTQAIEILHKGASATGVRVVEKGVQKDIEASRVVVAAGAVESARLLLLSGSWCNKNERVGKGLWFSARSEVRAFLHQSDFEKCADFMKGSPFVERLLLPAQNKGEHFDRTALLRFAFEQENPIQRAEKLSKEGGLLFGEALKSKLRERFSEGRTLQAMAYAESPAHPGAFVDLSGRARDQHGAKSARITHFHHPRTNFVAKDAVKKAHAIFEEIGAKEVKTHALLQSHEVLQGGTCRMGENAKQSVCDAKGAVHGSEGLTLCGAATLCSSLSVPTGLTIAANALRIAKNLSS